MEKIRIAVQKKGRLNDSSLKLIADCGIHFPKNSGQLKSPADNFPLEILHLRDDDIPGYVMDGVADIGIVGRNEIEEQRMDLPVMENLSFGKCRLSIAVPREKSYTGVNDLEGQIIATSYPYLLSRFLEENSVNAEIHEISGSVEIAPAIGLTDSICDLVSTGSTLLFNGLKEVETIFHSSAVLVRNRGLSPSKLELANRLLLRIRAVKRADAFKYILLNVPDEKIDEVINILPGLKSPTIMPLAQKGWSSLHSVIPEEAFWDNIERLHNCGAEGILVLPIEKIMF